MSFDSLYVIAVLCLIVVVSEWLVRHTALRHAGTALLSILVTAIAANTGILPAGSTAENPVPVYDAIFGYVAPLAIFWLVLTVNLREVMRAGLPIITLYLIGSAGTMLGTIVGMLVIGGPSSIGPLHYAIGGMFTGTYTGGSVNFNAIALEYQVMREGTLFAGATVVDNIITTLWIIATLALPRLLLPLWPKTTSAGTASDQPRGEVLLGIEEDTEAVHPQDVALLLAMGIGVVWVSRLAAGWTDTVGFSVPEVIIITTIALLLAQSRSISRLPGTRVLGMVAVYLFLAVIGAFCDVRAMGELGRLGLVLLAFATVLVLVHGTIIFTAARLMRLDLDVAAVASQANVGGSTSALALARSLGRADLVLPGILIGAVGNAIGTYLGFAVAHFLRSY